MKKFLAICVGVGIIVACSSEPKPCRLCGTFKQDAARTLSELEQSTLLSADELAKYRKYYFGHLIIETEPNRARAYLDHEDPEGRPWAPWEVISEDETSIHIRINRTGAWGESVIQLDGDCYMVEIPNEDWGHWFCRVAP